MIENAEFDDLRSFDRACLLNGKRVVRFIKRDGNHCTIDFTPNTNSCTYKIVDNQSLQWLLRNWNELEKDSIEVKIDNLHQFFDKGVSYLADNWQFLSDPEYNNKYKPCYIMVEDKFGIFRFVLTTNIKLYDTANANDSEENASFLNDEYDKLEKKQIKEKNQRVHYLENPCLADVYCGAGRYKDFNTSNINRVTCPDCIEKWAKKYHPLSDDLRRTLPGSKKG